MTSYNKQQLDAQNKYEIPSQHIESEGEKLIKNLVQKQLNSNVRLETQLQQSKEFEKPAALISITSFTAGQNDLNTFKEYSDHVHNLEELHFYGLVDSEIELLLDYEKGKEYIVKKHKNICKAVFQKDIDRIFTKINDAKAKISAPINSLNDSVSRHEKEIALCVKPNSDETKLYNFALSCSSVEKPSNSTSLDHPINQLPQLEKKLFGYLTSEEIVPSLRKRRKKGKKFLDGAVGVKSLIMSDCGESSLHNKKSHSKWDLREPSVENNFSLEATKEKVYTCNNKVYYTIKDNEIIKLKSFSDNTKETNGNTDIQNIHFKKLTENQIRSLPRFQNYQRGTPTKVLYVKNLANGTKEEELITLFNSICNDKCKDAKYRLLNGKMKGQAFITFDSTNEAIAVLEAVNGCPLKGKPVIIQYGRSPTS